MNTKIIVGDAAHPLAVIKIKDAPSAGGIFVIIVVLANRLALDGSLHLAVLQKVIIHGCGL